MLASALRGGLTGFLARKQMPSTLPPPGGAMPFGYSATGPMIPGTTPQAPVPTQPAVPFAGKDMTQVNPGIAIGEPAPFGGKDMRQVNPGIPIQPGPVGSVTPMPDAAFHKPRRQDGGGGLGGMGGGMGGQGGVFGSIQSLFGDGGKINPQSLASIMAMFG